MPLANSLARAGEDSVFKQATDLTNWRLGKSASVQKNELCIFVAVSNLRWNTLGSPLFKKCVEAAKSTKEERSWFPPKDRRNLSGQSKRGIKEK